MARSEITAHPEPCSCCPTKFDRWSEFLDAYERFLPPPHYRVAEPSNFRWNVRLDACDAGECDATVRQALLAAAREGMTPEADSDKVVTLVGNVHSIAEH